MQTSHIRNQLYLHRSKVGLLIFVFFTSSFSGFSQGLFGLTSTSGSDDKILSYGFFLAGHTATYQIKYSEAFFDPTNEIVNEATMVEFPLLFKYRSQRFNNTRMYFLGGGSYQFRTKSQDEANLDPIVTRGQDFSIEMGMGFEIYFKYFKFAPEIRFSHGLNNIYYAEKTPAEIRDAFSSIKRKGITIYLNFQ
jgi:hypothetical protein